MPANIKCLNCGETITADPWHCEKYGVDMAGTALPAEQQAAAPAQSKNYMIAPEILVPRNGEYLRVMNDTLQHQVEERTIGLRLEMQKLTEIHQLKTNNISHELGSPSTRNKGFLVISGGGILADQKEGRLSYYAS